MVVAIRSLGPIRCLFLAAMLALAGFSGHPGGSVISGALDRLLFDAMASVYAHDRIRNVVVVNIDAPTLDTLGLMSLSGHSAALFDRMPGARSIVLDLPLAAGADFSGLAQGMQRNGRIVLLLPDSGARTAIATALPTGSALRDAAAALGQRDVTVGHFGVVDGFVPYVQSADGVRPHVALEALRVAGIQPPVDIARYLQPHAVALGQVRTDSALVMLNGAEDLPQYSYLDVLRGRVPESAFAGKIVFIGHSRWLGEGTFQVSSLSTDEVTRAQLDALITDAVASGHLVRELPGSIAVPVYVLLALGITLICLLVPGRRMHTAAIGWGVILFAVPLALLACHVWLPIGLLPFVCLLIYGFFAWERHGRMLSLLRREVTELRTIAASIGAAPIAQTPLLATIGAGDELQNVKLAMRQIRAWQKLYADMINQLPYPVFLAMGGKVAVWNAKASEMMAGMTSGDTRAPFAQIEMLVSESLKIGGEVSREQQWGGREHLLVCEPLSASSGRGERSASSDDDEQTVSHLVCLIDIADVKRDVSHDKQVLRHIAHDLRSPLSSILALIERRGASESTVIGRQDDDAFLGDLRQQADYSLRVANAFMQLSRAEQLTPESFVPVMVEEVASEAIDHVSVKAAEKSIVVSGPHATVDSAFVLGDPDMLVRAFINVLDNAIKYSPPKTEIDVTLVTPDNANIEVRVQDQGIGMSEETVARLFEPFFQANRRKDADSGVGLGMPFVKAVIERHGGSIEVRSEPGQGTTFIVRLQAMDLK
jgi:CHASE2 domain-containing sensor protein/nitrogen-specific signal transduction histidine kinase